MSTTLTFADIPGTGDIKVLNYALALEQLEANFYNQLRKRLTVGGYNENGTNIPGLGLTTGEEDVQYVLEFELVERAHRDFLTAALGSSAIQPFKYDFGLDTKTRQQALDLLHNIERTGTSAYLGAINEFATTTYVQTAAAIQGTEARHTAVIARVCNTLFGETRKTAPGYQNNNGIDVGFAPDTVLAAISGFILT
jgi:hypothetical protein